MSGNKYIGIVVAGLLWAFLLPGAAGSSAEKDAATEGELRAAFVLNFARFIIWPGERPDSQAPLVIGVWGDPALGAVLDRVVAGQTVRGRKLAVRSIRDLPLPGEVDILYIPTGRQKQLGQWLAENAGSAILTISGSREFCKMGGMIALYPEGLRIRFEINQESLQRSGLRASSKLLALSKSGGSQ